MSHNTVPATKKRKSIRATKEQPAHVLLRLKSEGGHTISSHAKMISAKGVALFGKLGRVGLSEKFRDGLNKQIESSVKTYLYLTTRDGWNTPYITYRCSLIGVHESLSSAKRSLVPEYYIHESPHIRTWFEIASIDRLSREDMERIFVLSTGSPITSAIRGINSIFRVAMQPKPAK